MDRTGWIVVVAATAVTALVVGFGAGWLSYQTYLRISLQSAIEDIGTAPADEDGEPAAEPEPVEEPAGQPPAPTEPDPWPEAVPMGETASDGTWDITLKNVERTSQVSGSYTSARAGAGREFVVLEVELANASNGPQYPDVEDCEIVDADGNRYTYDTDALWALDEEDAMYSDLNPGASATMRIPFDVAEGARVEVALLTGVWSGPGVAELLVEED